MSLGAYVRRRNGVPLGASGALRNMLSRSLGARSFAAFWQYWNPIFGYGLARWVQAPLLRVVPAALATVGTFVVSGAIHDLVTTLVRGSPTLLFTPWFALLGIAVEGGRAARMDLSAHSWTARAAFNLVYLSAALALTILIRRFFAIP